ncbi:MAG: hypothetical protein AB7U41_02855 [Dongiaceae bacterium]
MANPKDPLGDFIVSKGPTDDISPERMAAEVYAEKVAADLADLGPGGKTRLQAELAAAKDRIAFLEGRLEDAQNSTSRVDQEAAKAIDEARTTRSEILKLRQQEAKIEKQIINAERAIINKPYGIVGDGMGSMMVTGFEVITETKPKISAVTMPVAETEKSSIPDGAFDQRIDAAGFEPKIVKLKGDDGKLKTYELPPEKQAEKASAQAAQGERNKIAAQKSTEETRKTAKERMTRDPQASVLLSATGALGKLLKDSVNLMDG